jgi:hypothetical protein
MDLLQHIDLLSKEQLVSLSQRDDATGVLAEYRLAALTNSPAPLRETVVTGQGYAIVAANGELTRVELDGVAKMIREEDGEYCVYSADGEQAFGCYRTMVEAQNRLQQIHYFEQAKKIGVGDHVLYSVPKPPEPAVYAHGRVDRIATTGTVSLPGTSESEEATSDNPVAVITVWAETDNGYTETDRHVVRPFSQLRTSTAPLEKKVSAKVMETLREKAKKHNEDVGDAKTKRTSARTLAAVFERGIGAYRTNPGSVRPNVSSAEQWAYGRVNGFLHALKTGSFKRGSFDTDLLPKGHPHSSKSVTLVKESFEPPLGVQESGQQALDWIAEGHAGDGFTDVGRARASQLARGDNVSRETIGRMASFLARHEGNSSAEGWNFGEDGFPSPGRVAYEAWGGAEGKTWADSIMGREKAVCPIATYSVPVNLKNRQTAIEVADYGPLNPGLPNNEYWEHLATYFDVTPVEARSTVCGNCAAFDQTSHIEDCIADGLSGDNEDPYDVIEQGDLGYCRVFKFKCASARTCSAWIAGGPIIDDEPLELAKAKFVRKSEDRQFTLGPLYVPDFMDAHGEWTDPDTLQAAVWGWVNSGDRRIFLQHDRDVEAGSWVEVMTMPQPWTVDMLGSDGSVAGKVTYPAGTVFLGVIWNDESWAKIKRGELRGYSIGGMAGSVYAEMPEDAVREGVEVPD